MEKRGLSEKVLMSYVKDGDDLLADASFELLKLKFKCLPSLEKAVSLAEEGMLVIKKHHETIGGSSSKYSGTMAIVNKYLDRIREARRSK